MGGSTEVRKPRYIGYTAAHGRVKRLRGFASTHECAHCGKQAQDWAYNHQDPNELKESAYGPFSLDPNNYLPLCCKCHAIFDRRGFKKPGAARPKCDGGPA